MFLAWNEIKYAKLRYSLIVGVMFLIAYLVFFLTGLAYGLSQDYRMAIDKWQADGIVLTDESNLNINMSMLPIKEIDQVDAADKAVFAQMAGVVKRENKNAKIDVSFFGIRKDEFLMPNLIEGKAFGNENEAVADISLKEEDGVKLNDTVVLAGTKDKVKIVGFTEGAKFTVSPVLYTSIDTFQKLRYEQAVPENEARINAIVVRGKDHSLDGVKTKNKDLKLYDMQKYISELPGYNAQVLTFGFMISFLIVIGAIVIGIFIYVLTMQKSTVFGVMKAQGISSRYISFSVIMQTIFLAAMGILIGLLGTLGTAAVLPSAVPFQSNWPLVLAIAGAMLIVAALGALFSVRTVVKVDPLKAIG